MDWIVTTGSTVDEALDVALDELAVTNDDIEFEVITEGRKSVFGFRRSVAQVRARVRPIEPPAKREWKRPSKSDKRKKLEKPPRPANQNPTETPPRSLPQIQKLKTIKVENSGTQQALQKITIPNRVSRHPRLQTPEREPLAEAHKHRTYVR